MKKRTFLLMAMIMALLVAIGATAAFAQVSDGAQVQAPAEAPEAQDDGDEEVAPAFPKGFHGPRGFGELAADLTPEDELLAQALDIDLETVQAAKEAVRQAIMEQALADAVEAGRLTQEQADAILEDGFLGRGGFGHGCLKGAAGDVDREAMLAAELNIDLDTLQAARQEVEEARLAEMLEAGLITQEQIDLRQAHKAFMDAVDHEALMAEALGIDLAEWQEARGDRQAMAELIEELGLSRTEIMEAMQAAYEAAVAQAVEDGILTDSQAELILGSGLGPHGFGGPGGFGGRGHRPGPGNMHGHGGFRGFASPNVGGATGTASGSI